MAWLSLKANGPASDGLAPAGSGFWSRHNTKLPAPSAHLFFSFTKILSDSPLLASIFCLVDERDNIHGHRQMIINTSSHPPTTNALFFLI